MLEKIKQIYEILLSIFDYSEIRYTAKTVNPFCHYIPEYRDVWLSDLFCPKNNPRHAQIEIIQNAIGVN